ncbi:hypothetical protein ACFOZY_00665 [Chungangia koreensis]|uniref:Uncharacterized protein n=1 Tax=Chungangia koreensis TaxID=752657 RepID=A0ABV8X3X3_9LACT
MQWFMWIFWGAIALLIVGGFLVDRLSGRKYDRSKAENSLNQNMAEADALREVDRYNHQNPMF